MATVGASGYSSQQGNQYDPGQFLVTNPVRIWGTTGNTDTVIDAMVHPSSVIVWSAVSATPVGNWKVTVTQGQFVITSSDVESAGLTYNYIVL